MQRRKMLAALGSLAAGGAAMFGTGAVTSVTANRSAKVNVAGDGSAYIKLVPGDDTGSSSSPSGPNAAYAEYNSDSELELNLDGTASSGFGGTQGDGVNPNAVTDIDQVFYVANQGTQDVGVWVEDSGSSADAVTFYAHHRNPNAPGTGSNTAPSGSGDNGTADADSIEKNGGSFDVGPVTMSPGDTMEVSIEVDSASISSTTGQILDSVTVYADADEA